MFNRAGRMLRGIGLSRAVTVGTTVGLTSSTASYCSTAAPATQVRIAQYNILSDSLDAPDHYIHCDPNDLDHEIRFQRVAAKLEEQMRAGAVLCLQEVTTPDSPLSTANTDSGLVRRYRVSSTDHGIEKHMASERQIKSRVKA